MIYSMFGPLPIPYITTPFVGGDETFHACDRSNREIEQRILTSEYDVASGGFYSEIELKWKGTGRPPTKLFVNLLITENVATPGLVIFSGDVINMPFADDRIVRSRITIQNDSLRMFSDRNNIYAFVDLSDDGKFPTSIDECKKRAVLIPVLKVHM